MADLQIASTDRLSENEIIVQLSDERTITFSLQKLLTLVPDSVVTEDEAAKNDVDLPH